MALAARELVLMHPEVEEVTLFVGRAAPKMHYSMVALEDNRPNYAQGLVQLNTPIASVELVQEVQDELGPTDSGSTVCGHADRTGPTIACAD